MHALCLTTFYVGFSWVALGIATFMYIIRMFAITAFYHRYFSHRTYRTTRFRQFVFAVLGNSSCQRGPLWWSAHHRMHHRYSDQPGDVHSPRQHGVLWSHLGWFMARRNARSCAAVRDWAKFPELVFLDRFHTLVPAATAAGLYGLGCGLHIAAPGLGTDGLQVFVWGFLVSTVCVYHGTFSLNSLAHLFGTRRYATGDDSRNNLLLALLMLGEGWHNNHHYYPHSARQGFFWWEIDVTYLVLKVMAKLGLIWGLREIPESRRGPGSARVGRIPSASAPRECLPSF
jgi:stearoyl-CoA desaturase (delta-9 desaturase)